MRRHPPAALSLVFAGLLSLAGLPAMAQGRAGAADAAAGFPTKPVRMVVPLAPGGGSDIVGRIVALSLAERWGQSVVVDNRPGAGGNIGNAIVAKSPPDGYTLLVSSSTMAISPSLYRDQPADIVRDFQPVTLLASQPSIVVAHPSVPAKTLKELIAVMRAQPGKLTFGSAGAGTASHLANEQFLIAAGVKALHTVGRTIPGLPAVVSLGSLTGVLAPVFGVLLPVRAAESVVRGSVFRSGYELLYIPVEAGDKRAAKTVIDVGADRLGEAVGSGIDQFFIVLGSAAVSRWVLMMTAVVGLITLMVSRFIGSAYAEVLARSIERRAGELDLDVARDWANLSIVMESGVLPRPDLSLTPSGGLTLNNRPRGPMLADQAPGARRDPVLDTLAELRCGDPGRISRAVLDLDASDPLIAAQLVQLLAVDEVSRDVRAALAKVAPKIVGISHIVDEAVCYQLFHNFNPQADDIHGAARHKMLQVADQLGRAS